jgi:hypothetical protein
VWERESLKSSAKVLGRRNQQERVALISLEKAVGRANLGRKVRDLLNLSCWLAEQRSSHVQEETVSKVCRLGKKCLILIQLNSSIWSQANITCDICYN